MTALPSRVLLTGGTGFIGRRLHRALLDHDVAVRLLVRNASAPPGVVDPRCELCIGALTDAAAVADAVAGVDAVVYAAGAVRGRSPGDFHAANVGGVATVAAALARANPTVGMVLLSSLAASRPALSDYAASKHLGEQALADSGHAAWMVLRPPAVYGPGDAELRPLLALVRRGLAVRPGPADQRLALLHVDDLCRAVLAALRHLPACHRETFTLHDGRESGYDWGGIAQAVAGRRVRELGLPVWLLHTLAQANHALSALTGRPPMLTRGKVRELRQSDWLCDNRDFTRATGWVPQIDLARGAAELFRVPPESDTP
jgi:2-alkyl-3-oxoalkanoate reductase